jgi:hypothetical protein
VGHHRQREHSQLDRHALNVLSAADLPSIDFEIYSSIVVSSVQPQSFYDTLGTYMPAIKTWLKNHRHTLEFHGADFGGADGHWTFSLPGGVTSKHVLDYTNYVVNDESPLMVGVPSVLNGNYASHNNLKLGSVASSAIVVSDSANKPTLLDYCIAKKGRVVVTGITVEFSYNYSYDFAAVLPNMLSSTALTPGCLE